MARLNIPSRRAATPDRARPPPLSSHPSTSTDAEAASLQLLTEAASATKMPRSAAVDGANLLNAARVHAPSTAPKKKDGKLSRPSILANEQPRTNLASRGNLYDVLSSPEKDSFSLPDKVNRKPLKVAKKTKLPPASTHESAVDEVNVLETHSSGNPRCTAVYYKYDKEKGSHYRQCHRPGPNSSDAGPRCKTHMLNTPVVRCEYATVKDTDTTQCPKPASNETIQGPRCAEHAEQPVRGATRKTQPQVQIPVRSRSKQAKSTTIEAEDTSHITQNDGEPSTVAEVPPESTLNGRQKGRKSQRAKVKTSGSQSLSGAKEKMKETAATTNKSQATVKKSKAKEPTANPIEDDISDPQEINTDGDQSENPSSSDEETETQQDIHDVFKYLTSDECSGQCETKLGDTIRQTCEESWLSVRAKDASIDTIADDIKTIRADIKQILADIPEEDRPVFKGDAYAYIFRALVSYLEAVYSWLRKKYSEVRDSLDAMRMLCSLIQVILGVKDVTYSWKVSAPPRSDGEAVVKIVDSKLIVPLRKVDATFRTQLRHLKAQETHRQRQAELKRKRVEGAEDERRRAEDEIGKLERWKRWQDLHVLRMQLEPDAFRRRKRLMIKKPDSLEERDANGVRFERVPIFKVRSSLVRHWISIAHEDREWTTAEEEALLKGLQDFAGPKVFEKIFKEYCHAPRGILRDFSVSGIFAKAAWFHSQCVALSQEREDFEVPTYLAELPTILSMYPSPSLSY